MGLGRDAIAMEAIENRKALATHKLKAYNGRKENEKNRFEKTDLPTQVDQQAQLQNRQRDADQQ